MEAVKPYMILKILLKNISKGQREEAVNNLFLHYWHEFFKNTPLSRTSFVRYHKSIMYIRSDGIDNIDFEKNYNEIKAFLDDILGPGFKKIVLEA